MAKNVHIDQDLNLVVDSEEIKLQEDKSLRALAVIKNELLSGTCDLNIHTAVSDGTEVSSYILKKVIEHGLRAFSITDYDTMDAVNVMEILVDKMLQLGINCPNFIRGIELTFASNGDNLGLLAYFPLGYGEELNSFLENKRNIRETRNREICKRLNELGLKIDYEEVLAMSIYVVGRSHIANVLVRKGYVASTKEAFSLFLNKGCYAYVPFESESLEVGISVVRQAGGVPVLTYHALKNWLDISYETAKNKLLYFKEKGLLGIQAIHGQTNEDEIQRNIFLAQEVGLQVFSGSGYRGYIDTSIDIFRGEMDFSRFISVKE